MTQSGNLDTPVNGVSVATTPIIIHRSNQVVIDGSPAGLEMLASRGGR